MDAIIRLKKSRKENFYTIEELEKLNTKRLLAFYKKERVRYLRFSGSVYCECCGQPYSDIYPDDKYYVEEQPKIASQWRVYVDEVKKLLNKREHVD